MHDSLHLTIPSKVDAIAPVMERLAPIFQEHLSDQEGIVDVAVQEALNNAVIHGNRYDSRKMIQVFCRFEQDGTLDVIVRDEGKGFNPASVPSPISETRLLSGHGRGIFLMKALMDEVYFEEGGKQVHMRKSRTPAAALKN